MNSLIPLLVRHGLAALGGFFAAHGIDGSSTIGIITGLALLLIPLAWSWVVKALHIDDTKLTGIANGDIVRVLIGSLVSQLITWLSTYFAVDANNPELLGVALANAGASKLGWHQKAAFIGSQAVIKALALCSLLSLISCTTPQRQLVVSLSEIGLSLAQSRGVIQEGDKVVVGQSVALILNNEASTRDKVVRLTDLGLKAAVDRGTLKEGDALLIREATAVIERAMPQTSAKQPIQVLPQIQGSPQIQD